MKMQQWFVGGRYAAPGERPRHPSPEHFRRRAVVGPPTIETLEALFDLLDIPETDRAAIRSKEVAQAFVEGRLGIDDPYPHNVTGMHYVNDGTQLVEWDITFKAVTRMLVDQEGVS